MSTCWTADELDWLREFESPVTIERLVKRAHKLAALFKPVSRELAKIGVTFAPFPYDGMGTSGYDALEHSQNVMDPLYENGDVEWPTMYYGGLSLWELTSPLLVYHYHLEGLEGRISDIWSRHFRFTWSDYARPLRVYLPPTAE